MEREKICYCDLSETKGDNKEKVTQKQKKIQTNISPMCKIITYFVAKTITAWNSAFMHILEKDIPDKKNMISASKEVPKSLQRKLNAISFVYKKLQP